jgi:hypothetical protein
VTTKVATTMAVVMLVTTVAVMTTARGPAHARGVNYNGWNVYRMECMPDGMYITNGKCHGRDAWAWGFLMDFYVWCVVCVCVQKNNSSRMGPGGGGGIGVAGRLILYFLAGPDTRMPWFAGDRLAVNF